MVRPRLRYRVEGVIDPAFRADHERTMPAACGADPLPNPHAARHGLFHNDRPWDSAYTRTSLERLAGESGLEPEGDAIVEKRNWLVGRTHVNVFLALRK